MIFVELFGDVQMKKGRERDAFSALSGNPEVNQPDTFFELDISNLGGILMVYNTAQLN